MDRQTFLILEDAAARREAARRFCERRGLTERQVAILAMLAGEGDRENAAGQALTCCRISKRDAALRLRGTSGNTFLRDVRKLVSLGVMWVLKETKPATYIVNWSRIDKLEPPPEEPTSELAKLPIVAADWTPVGPTLGQAGPPVRDSESLGSLESETVYRDSESSVIRGADRLTSLARPWSRDDGPAGGITDDELVQVVRYQRRDVLRHLYREAVALGWIRDCTDAKLRFLTIAHHAATSSGIGNRMGLLVARCKRGLDVDRTRHDSETWATEILKPQRQCAEVRA